jgi:hypothetical protein
MLNICIRKHSLPLLRKKFPNNLKKKELASFRRILSSFVLLTFVLNRTSIPIIWRSNNYDFKYYTCRTYSVQHNYSFEFISYEIEVNHWSIEPHRSILSSLCSRVTRGIEKKRKNKKIENEKVNKCACNWW